MIHSTKKLVAVSLFGLLVIVGLALSCAIALADEQPTGSKTEAKPDVPKVIKLTLHPAKPPDAALQYPLLPRFIDQSVGNAVPLYLKAITSLEGRKDPDDLWDKVDRWLEMPLSELPIGEVEKVVEMNRAILKNVTLAAHRDRADWDSPVHEDQDVFGILLPEMNPLRRAGRLLALKARFQIAQGHVSDALATLQTGYALARHTGEYPFLVCSMVGIAISQTMDQQMETLIQSPKCPNLYWSLTALPSPLIDLRPATNLESDFLFLAFPELRDIEHAEHSPEEWEAVLVHFVRRYQPMMDWRTLKNKWDDIGMTALMTGRAMALLPRAKDDLIKAGRDRKEVEAMPAAQIVLLHEMMIYKATRDEVFKWFSVPYWQAREGMLGVDQKVKEEVRSRELIPIASLLLPALTKVRDASVRGERRIALLRVIEALRFYAAEHDGKLPAALDDIKEVPIPVDPVTGKSFGYSLSEDKATLDAPPPHGETWEGLGARYEVTIAAK
jgi:hypothetical protein